MKITLISPARADINAHFTMLKPAFNGVSHAKAEYEHCCELVASKQASLYRIKGHSVDVRFVGVEVADNEYLVLALAGKGIVDAAAMIIDLVSKQGYRALKYHTARRGMTRILSRYGFTVIGFDEREVVLKLMMEGV